MKAGSAVLREVIDSRRDLHVSTAPRIFEPFVATGPAGLGTTPFTSDDVARTVRETCDAEAGLPRAGRLW